MRVLLSLLLTLVGASALASPSFVRLQPDGQIIEDATAPHASRSKAAPRPVAASRTKSEPKGVRSAKAKSHRATSKASASGTAVTKATHSSRVKPNRRAVPEVAPTAQADFSAPRPSVSLAHSSLLGGPTTSAQPDALALPTPSGTAVSAVTVTTAAPTTGAVARSAAGDLVIRSMAFLGVPYRPGGTSDKSGFDCSGFVQSMFERTLGRVLPRSAHAQAQATERIEVHQLQPGDLVFYNTLQRAFSHVGIYVGEGKFIHSPAPGGRVRVEDMSDHYWKTRFNGARRVPELEAPSAVRLAAVP